MQISVFVSKITILLRFSKIEFEHLREKKRKTKKIRVYKMYFKKCKKST